MVRIGGIVPSLSEAPARQIFITVAPPPASGQELPFSGGSGQGGGLGHPDHGGTDGGRRIGAGRQAHPGGELQ